MGEHVKAMVEAEQAIRYDPNYANAHVLLVTLLYYAGRPEEGNRAVTPYCQGSSYAVADGRVLSILSLAAVPSHPSDRLADRGR